MKLYSSTSVLKSDVILNKSGIVFVSLFVMFFIFVFVPLSYAVDCGNVDCSVDEEPSISDITRLIDFLYISHLPLCDSMATDVNFSGGIIDLSDITRLIDFLYISHTPLYCWPETVMDIDGNVYETVKIGPRLWMAENLKTTRYNTGDEIPKITDDETWMNLSTGAYCEYENDVSHVETYGRLYNGYAVIDSRSIAPEGWHVATDAEWKEMEMYLGMSQSEADASGRPRGTDEGGKLKEAGTTHWIWPNLWATNESGFTGLPGGSRSYLGTYDWMRLSGHFWTNEQGSGCLWRRVLYAGELTVWRDCYDKRYGHSVRCVMNYR